MWNKLVIFGLSVLAFVALPTASAGNVTRHCDGWYYMDVVKENDTPVSRGTSYSLGDFSGEGSCGSTVKNRCRERARDKLRACYKAHWQVRWDRERPEACTQSKGVQRYAIDDIKKQMEVQVCCDPDAAGRNSAVVDLYGVTSGDNGCGAKIVHKTFKDPSDLKTQMLVQEGYKMDCQAIRQNYCPGMLFTPKRTN